MSRDEALTAATIGQLDNVYRGIVNGRIRSEHVTEVETALRTNKSAYDRTFLTGLLQYVKKHRS